MGLGGNATTGALFASGYFLFVLTISYVVGHRLRPTWGMQWLAGSHALSLARVALSATPVGALVWWPHAAAVLAAASLAAMFVGLRAYTDRPLGHPLVGFAAGVLSWFALRAGFQAMGMAGMSGPYVSGVLFVFLAFVCAQRLKAFAGGAYMLAATVLFLHPVFVLGVGGALFGGNLESLRGWSGISLSTVGLVILMASMGRLLLEIEREVALRRQAEATVREANALLEIRVKDRTAELEELVGDLESFNRMVSHDLRGPLGGIRGMAEVGLKRLSDGDVSRLERYLKVIQIEADRLDHLVNQLLMLAKVTHADIDCKETRLQEVLEKALETLALTHAPEQMAHVKVEGGWPKAKVDPVLFQQVFVNLIGNALKFAAATDQPQVRVNAIDRPGEVVVEVQDNGPGFQQDLAGELFQPFKRLHGGEVAGHGIGLSIVRRIVERHGGKVWAEGQPGLGARFFFSLPA